MKLTVAILVLSSLLYVYINLHQVNSIQENSNFTDQDSADMSEKNETPTDPELLSFTDLFIMRRAGRKINVTRLIMEYSLICPVSYSCGADFDSRFLLNLDIELRDACSRCTCDYECVKRGTCCPGSHYGYVDHECVNTMLYPKDGKQSYYMVGKCNEVYNGNRSIIEMCETEIDPCTSIESKLVYKNQHCALCNEDTNCIPWELKLECLNFMAFESSMSSFTSNTDMRKALDAYDCRIQFSIEKSFKAPRCFREDNKHDDHVNKCNVTGLWMVYDEDIEWACENFVNPYKDLRNVYCYICNPSRANEQNVALIGEYLLPKCNPVLPILHEACKAFPTSTRLAPFKNIYCYYACNKDQSMLQNTTDNMDLMDISEKNDDALRTKLSLAIVYSGENKFEQIRKIINELLKDFSTELMQSISPLRPGKTDVYSSHLSYLVNEYINVCGMETVCNSSTKNDTIIYGNPVCGKCTCKSDCAEFENCCPEVLLKKQPYSCMESRMFPIFYKYMKNQTAAFYERINATYRIIDICLKNDTEAELSKNCSSYLGTSDFFRNIPITTDTDNAYKNIYCFICNSNAFDAVLQFQAFCDTYIEYALFTNINILIDNIKSHCNKISFVPIQSKSCVENYNLTIAGSIGGEKYVRKKLHPLLLEFKIVRKELIHIKDLYKPVKRVYAACNETHKTHDVLKQVCESNVINVLALPEYRLENKVYKNFACFICNPDTDVVEMSQYNVTSECLLNDSVEWYVYNWELEKLCHETKLYPRWLPYKNLYCSECNLPPWQLVDVHVGVFDMLGFQPYKYIFSISRTDFENLERASDRNYITDCPGGIYDHSRGRCQVLYCSGGFQLVNKSCKPILESASRRLYNIPFFLKYQNEDDTNATGVFKTPLIVKLKDICTRVGGQITRTVEPTTAHFIQSGHCTTYSCLPRKLTPNSMNDDMYIDITKTTIISVFFSIAIDHTNNISAVHTALLKALNQSYVITNISDIKETPRSFRLYSYNAETVSLVASSLANFCVFRYSPFLIFEPATIYSQYSVDKYLTCPHVRLNLSETIMNDKTAELYYMEDNITFRINEYKIQGNFAIICLSDFSKKSPLGKMIHNKHPLDSTLKSFTFACSIISLVCLFITFITYCRFASLRTIPGKNIMTLCFFLFCSQCFLQFGIGLANETKLCIAIGMCNHFCWLASFCVMNVCSFHMFRLFCLRNFTRSVVSNLQQKHLFLKYLFFVTCLPLILVLVTVSVSLTVYKNIGYGKHYCFISDFYIFIGTFFVPACLIFVSNIIFFSIAFHRIRLTPTVQSNQNRNNFFVCVRLCTIVGITWPLIIVENVLNLSWFSFLVSGLNALQGCFIFFSFVVNKRVYSLVLTSIRNTYLKHSTNTERSGTEFTD